MHGAARLAQTTAGTACNIKQAAWWGIWKPQTPKAGTRPRRGLPESDPNPSQRLKPKGSTLRPRGAQGTVFGNAVRSRHDLHPCSNPEYRRPAANSCCSEAIL